ncbi:MAG: hypothetical protein ACR2RB_22005, partial [Gammaproteobacteria bacterium]
MLWLMVAMTACSLPWKKSLSPAQMSGHALCVAYFEDAGEQHRAQIEARGLIDEAHWESVEENKLASGMSLCAMHAAWGDDYDKREYTSVLGPTTQYIYDRGGYREAYIYVKDGGVTSLSTFDRAEPGGRKGLFSLVPVSNL